jgi:hypothetical protein
MKRRIALGAIAALAASPGMIAAASLPMGPACSFCGARQSIPVVFGLASDEMERRRERGEIALGGCCPDGFTKRECRNCGRRFGWR